MILLPVAALIYVLGAILSARRVLSYSIALVASVIALSAGILALAGQAATFSIPFADGFSVSVGLDRTSALFLSVSSLSSLVLSIFAIGYGRLYGAKTAAAFSLGFAGTLLVFAAGDALTFLAGWELVTIFSYLLMTEDVGYGSSGLKKSRFPRTSAGFRFLIFGEISTVLLLIGFAALFVQFRTISFAAVKDAAPVFLILTATGAAIKMDAVPFHVWMPSVYEQTADHSSAFLSVPLTLMGLYALERFISMSVPSVPLLMILVLFGSVTAFWGALQAAAARKLKSLPAYSTVENNGMIIAVVAVAALAGASGTKTLLYLSVFAGSAAAVLALGHALAKSLLFMSIGHAKESLGVRTIDETRGVWKGVGPVPGVGILVAGLSLSAFPPLLGFTGEWMVLETVFQSSRFHLFGEQIFLAVAGFLLALAIGLGVFAMVKLIGYTALGYHHERFAARIPDRPMKVAQVLTIVLLPVLGIAVPALLPAFGFSGLFGGLLGVPSPLLLESGNPFFGVVSPSMFAVVIVILGAVPIMIWRLRRGRVRAVVPWSGGIPLGEKEYFTEPAFSQILLHMLRRFYGTVERSGHGTRQLHIRDLFSRPLRSAAAGIQSLGRIVSRSFMNGHVYYYVAYILVAFVLVLLIPW